MSGASLSAPGPAPGGGSSSSLSASFGEAANASSGAPSSAPAAAPQATSADTGEYTSVPDHGVSEFARERAALSPEDRAFVDSYRTHDEERADQAQAKLAAAAPLKAQFQTASHDPGPQVPAQPPKPLTAAQELEYKIERLRREIQPKPEDALTPDKPAMAGAVDAAVDRQRRRELHDAVQKLNRMKARTYAHRQAFQRAAAGPEQGGPDPSEPEEDQDMGW